MVFEKRNNGVSLRKKQISSHSAEDDNQLSKPNLPKHPTEHDEQDEKRKPRVLPISQINWKTQMRSGSRASMLWLAITLSVIFFYTEEQQELHGLRYPSTLLPPATSHQRIGRQMQETSPPPTGSWKIPDPLPVGRFLDNLQKIESRGRDYGGLHFTRRPKNTPIAIDTDDLENYETMRSELLDEIDGKLSAELTPLSDKVDQEFECQLPPWTGYTFPNCNQIHELVIERPYDRGQNQGFEVSYLASGSYRDAWRLKRSETDQTVLKRLILAPRFEWGAKDLYRINKEAIIMERLSATPRVLNIHGFCGTSVHVEAMRGDLWTKIIPGEGLAAQADISKLDNEHLSQNKLTPSEKLQISLSMAESLADLHGFVGGPIVHADTHIEQWLIARDGSIQLNDFNNAVQPQWDARNGAYCETTGGYGGTYRAPEEFEPSAQDESRDVFSYANNIYTLLTGLWPFYDDEFHSRPSSDTQNDIINGTRPYVDPRFRNGRTYIESKLVEIMERCWHQARQDRPPIYEVVDFLRQVKQHATRLGELHPSKLIQIPM